MQPSHPLTITSNSGLLRVIACECHVCAAFDPSNLAPGQAAPSLVPFQAIWDTGATASVISQAVVDACGLKPTGMQQVHGVGGVAVAETYLVNIRLPNMVGFLNLNVTKGMLPPGTPMLIGMDIISQGDLSITNNGGRTVFSFRYPSIGTTDFVAEHHEQMRREQQQAPRTTSGRGVIPPHILRNGKRRGR